MDGGAWWAAIHGVAKSQTRLPFHFSLSCIGEGNGNPLQCSCLENPRDGGAWWAAISGVAQSRTWLKQLSSSSSSIAWFSILSLFHFEEFLLLSLCVLFSFQYVICFWFHTVYFSSHITFYLWKFDLPLFYILYSFPYILNLWNTVMTILVFFFSDSNFYINYESVSMDWFLFYYRYYFSAPLTAQFF